MHHSNLSDAPVNNLIMTSMSALPLERFNVKNMVSHHWRSPAATVEMQHCFRIMTN